MKKIKLIFGLLIIATFVAVTAYSYTSSSNENLAVRKDRVIIPRQG